VPAWRLGAAEPDAGWRLAEAAVLEDGVVGAVLPVPREAAEGVPEPLEAEDAVPEDSVPELPEPGAPGWDVPDLDGSDTPGRLSKGSGSSPRSLADLAAPSPVDGALEAIRSLSMRMRPLTSSARLPVGL